MSFGSKVRKKSKERILEVSSDHLMMHLQAFMLAGGLIARDEVVADYILPDYITVRLKKVNEEGT